jgi:thiamine kinase-like enzyme
MKNFFNEFLKICETAVIYSHNTSIEAKKAIIPEIDSVLSYFAGEVIEEKESYKQVKELINAVNALIYIQNYYWNNDKYNNIGYTYDKSLKGRIDRGNYLNDKDLEDEYKVYLDLYSKLPKTLCNDDLLPFNIINNYEAKIIDWEYAGMLPYLTSFARLLAHAGEDDEFFYMKEADKDFIIKYYYDNLLKSKDIDYNDYLYSLNYFFLYEYCEWIMLGNKYENSNIERYNMYKDKAKRLILNIKAK